MKLLLLALVPACFALNPVTGRALADDFGPATPVAGALVARRARHGLCATAAYVASRTTEATNIGVICGCASALVAVSEIAAGRQRASPLLLVGIGACLLGVVLILTKGHPEALTALRFNPEIG